MSKSRLSPSKKFTKYCRELKAGNKLSFYRDTQYGPLTDSEKSYRKGSVAARYEASAARKFWNEKHQPVAVVHVTNKKKIK